MPYSRCIHYTVKTPGCHEKKYLTYLGSFSYSQERIVFERENTWELSPLLIREQNGLNSVE
jgi:hypothetical protein